MNATACVEAHINCRWNKSACGMKHAVKRCAIAELQICALQHFDLNIQQLEWLPQQISIKAHSQRSWLTGYWWLISLPPVRILHLSMHEQTTNNHPSRLSSCLMPSTNVDQQNTHKCQDDLASVSIWILRSTWTRPRPERRTRELRTRCSEPESDRWSPTTLRPVCFRHFV